MKALILGHSQVIYFHEYVTAEDIKCLSYSGCLIENVLDEGEGDAKKIIPNTQVRVFK